MKTMTTVLAAALAAQAQTARLDIPAGDLGLAFALAGETARTEASDDFISVAGSYDFKFMKLMAGYSDGGKVASIRIIPAAGNNANPGPGEMLRWHNAQLTSLNEFAATAFAGTAKVDAEFWMVNPSNDARFVNSTMSRTILQSTRGVNACANARGSEIDTYIDVADDFNENQMPKTRFSSWSPISTTPITSAASPLAASSTAR